MYVRQAKIIRVFWLIKEGWAGWRAYALNTLLLAGKRRLNGWWIFEKRETRPTRMVRLNANGGGGGWDEKEMRRRVSKLNTFILKYQFHELYEKWNS